jgi:hypothetical protein
MTATLHLKTPAAQTKPALPPGALTAKMQSRRPALPRSRRRRSRRHKSPLPTHAHSAGRRRRDAERPSPSPCRVRMERI